MIRSDIRNLALYFLDDLNGDYFTPVQMNVFINNAQRECAKQLVQAYEMYFLKVANTTTVASQADYVLPSDFNKLNRLELVVSGTATNEDRTKLYSITLNQQDSVSLKLGTPICYYLKKNRITLMPTPDRALTLRLYYSTLPVDMSADTDTPDVPSDFHEYIAVLAALDGFVKDDRAPANLLEKKTAYLTLMKQQAEDRLIDQPRYVVITDEGFGSLV